MISRSAPEVSREACEIDGSGLMPNTLRLIERSWGRLASFLSGKATPKEGGIGTQLKPREGAGERTDGWMLQATALVVFSGVLHVLALPPHSYGWLGFVALVPFLAVLRLEARFLQRIFLGLIFGLVTVVGTSHWMPRSIEIGNQLAPAVALVLAVLVTLWFTLAFVAFPPLLQWLEKGRLGGPWAAPIVWVALEAFRGAGMPAVEWLVYAHTQTGNLPALQWLDVAGAPGLSFLLVLLNALLVEALWPRPGWSRWKPLLAFSGGLAVLLLMGGWRLQAQERFRLDHEDEWRSVAVAQLAVPQSERWDPQAAWPRVEQLLSISEEAFAQGVEWVVWPETAMEIHIDKASGLANRMQALMTARPESELILGVPRESVEQGESRFYNSAVVLNQEGAVGGVYDKTMLYPITEAAPDGLRWIPGFDQVFDEQLQWAPYTPGATDQPLLETANVSLGVLICSEGLGASMARQRVDEGAEVIVHMANDAVIPGAMPVSQHFAIVRLRAIELRRPLLRASNWGESAVVSASGRVLARHERNQAGFAVAGILPRKDRTPYVAGGWLLPWICGGMTLLGGFWPQQRKRD